MRLWNGRSTFKLSSLDFLNAPHYNFLMFIFRQQIAVSCDDQTISVYTLCGRRLLPAMALPDAASILRCNNQYLMVVTANASLYLW